MEAIPIIAGVGLTAALVWLAVVDLRTMRLPNALTLPLIAIGVAYSAWFTGALQASVIGAALGYGVFFTIEQAYRRLRGQHGLGRGDAKLAAAGGAWCGWMGLPFIVMMASLSAILAVLILRDRLVGEGGRVPFGPFLAMGIAAVYWAQLVVSG